MKKKKNILKKYFFLSWNYIGLCKNYIFMMIGIFFLFGLIGFFVPAPVEIEAKILELIENLLLKTQGLSAFGLIEFIFLNNFEVSLFSFIIGIFLGIFPLFVSLTNGYLVGFISVRVVAEGGIFSLWRLLPHGIFELTAIFISLGMGLRLAIIPIFNLFKKKKLQKVPSLILSFLFVLFVPFISALIFLVLNLLDVKLRKELWILIKNSLITFFVFVFPLLVVAAIIEGFLVYFLK
jgi:stage II sporulation protein M